MNKKSFVLLLLLAFIIFPFIIQGAKEAPIPLESLVLDVSDSWLPTNNNPDISQKHSEISIYLWSLNTRL